MKKKRLITKTYQIGLSNMLKVSLLLSLVIFASCAVGRKVRLKNFTYDLTRNAKLTIESMKRVEHKIEIDILGISVAEDAVVIKSNEITCGAGDTKFKKVSVSGAGKDKLIIFPKTSFYEFLVTCTNPVDVSLDEDPYLIFKNIYKLQNNTAGEIIGSNIKIKFE